MKTNSEFDVVPIDHIIISYLSGLLGSTRFGIYGVTTHINTVMISIYNITDCINIAYRHSTWFIDVSNIVARIDIDNIASYTTIAHRRCGGYSLPMNRINQWRLI